AGAPAGRARPTEIDGRRGVELVVDSDLEWARKNELQYCLLVPSCWAASKASSLSAAEMQPSADRRVELVTERVTRRRAIAVWARPPAGVNRPPFGELYGVLLTFGDRDVMLLIGGEPGAGTLPSGVPYETVAAPPDTWTRVPIDLAALEAKYAPGVYPRGYPTPRLPFLDLPFVGLELRYVLATRSQELRRATFGL